MSERSIHLIDRDELLATLEQDIDVSVTGEENMKAVQKCLQEIMDDVKESPVVDAVPVKHGKWIHEVRYTIDSLHSYQQYRCSECGMTYITHTKYCPECGARMRDE